MVRLFYKARYFGTDEEVGEITTPLVGIDVSASGTGSKTFCLKFIPGDNTNVEYKKKIESLKVEGREPFALEFKVTVNRMDNSIEGGGEN